MRQFLMRTIPCFMVATAFYHMSAAKAETVKITLVTDWKAEPELGGFYEAYALGLYKKQGLDVTIRSGGPGINNMQMLAAGAINFAIAGDSFAPLNLVQSGAKAKVVMAALQKDPQCLMTHPRDDIKSLADMKGKPLMLSSDGVDEFFLWLKARYHFTDSQIRPYTFNMAPFLVNKEAIQQCYITSEPYIAQQQGGFKPQVYLLADNGYPSYASLLVVSDKMIDEHPAIVQKFVNASIEGWYDYLNGNPAPANALIEKDDPEETSGLIAYALKTMKAEGMVQGGEAKTLGIGAMTDERWKHFFDIMSKEGVYPAGMDYKSAYSLQFIKDAKLQYPEQP